MKQTKRNKQNPNGDVLQDLMINHPIPQKSDTPIYLKHFKRKTTVFYREMRPWTLGPENCLLILTVSNQTISAMRCT